MKYDELAFLNEQLAGMLKSGIPLETGLRQLCAGMRRGKWRREFEKLQADLSQGVPLSQAVDRRDLPDLYKRMVEAGAKSNNFPAILTLLADYYQKTHFLWTRLKGLMVYPIIIVGASLALSVFLVQIARSLPIGLGIPPDMPQYWGAATQAQTRSLPVEFWMVGTFLPIALLAFLTVALIVIALAPPVRRRAKWILPGFKDGQLSHLASALSLMLKSGCTLDDSLALAQKLEQKTRIGGELAAWRTQLAEGQSVASGARFKVIPPLFLWLVASEGEDLSLGFSRAAEIYHSRAVQKSEMMLYALLPVSVLMLGIMILAQLVSAVELLLSPGMGYLELFKFLSY